MIKSELAGGANSAVLLVEDSNPRIVYRELITDRKRVVCTAIINQDDFDMLQRLGDGRSQTTRKPDLRIVNSNDDGNKGFHSSFKNRNRGGNSISVL